MPPAVGGMGWSVLSSTTWRIEGNTTATHWRASPPERSQKNIFHTIHPYRPSTFGHHATPSQGTIFFAKHLCGFPGDLILKGTNSSKTVHQTQTLFQTVVYKFGNSSRLVHIHKVMSSPHHTDWSIWKKPSNFGVALLRDIS